MRKKKFYLCCRAEGGASIHPGPVPRIHRGGGVPGHVRGAHWGAHCTPDSPGAPAGDTTARGPYVGLYWVAVLLFALNFTIKGEKGY